jgi:hypothetical protein
MRTNDAWAEQVAQQVATEVRTSTASHKDLLREVWQLTKNEIKDGFAGTPMTLHELRAQYGQGEQMTCRVISCLGVNNVFHQARGPDGNLFTHANGSPILEDKIMLIDDCKRRKNNESLQKPSETIHPCRLTFMAYVCQEVVRQAKALVSTNTIVAHALCQFSATILDTHHQFSTTIAHRFSAVRSCDIFSQSRRNRISMISTRPISKLQTSRTLAQPQGFTPFTASWDY